MRRAALRVGSGLLLMAAGFYLGWVLGDANGFGRGVVDEHKLWAYRPDAQGKEGTC